MTSVRAFRGAIQVDQDDPGEVRERVMVLVSTVLESNHLARADLISMIITATPDLVSCFPASAVRELGIDDVPLIGAQELSVEGALPRVVRVLVHAETSLERGDVRHVYLRGAALLRPDIAAVRREPHDGCT